MVIAGLTPSEALVAATVSPARYFGVEEEYGRIAEGKAADMVLLRENPLTDIRNTRSIEAVVLGGRLYKRENLDALLAHVESSVGSLTLGAKLLWAYLWMNSAHERTEVDVETPVPVRQGKASPEEERAEEGFEHESSRRVPLVGSLAPLVERGAGLEPGA